MSLESFPSDLKISLSGVRGIVDRSFTPELVRRFGQAFGQLVKGGKVLLARDTRPTGVSYLDLLSEILVRAGCEVIEIGICPTPTLLWAVRHLRAAGGIMLTASHNPSEWNGLKFVDADGQFLGEARMRRLLRFTEQEQISRGRRGSHRQNRTVLCRYMEAILAHVDRGAIRRRRFKVAIDPCNGAGAVLTPAFLEALGCRIHAINKQPDGRFAHPPEPIPAHLTQLSRLVRNKRADIGFAQDPDADRLALVTEEGTPLSGEYTLALAVQEVLARKRGPVVVNLSTSRMVEELAGRAKVPFYRTRIGERHVVEKMMRVRAVIGGEGNGGVIYPEINPARDSFVGIALLLQSLSSGARLSRRLKFLPASVMLQERLLLKRLPSLKKVGELLKRRYPEGRLDRQDGIRLEIRSGWVHIRPSNTEPLVRVVAEDRTEQGAKRFIQEAISILS